MRNLSLVAIILDLLRVKIRCNWDITNIEERKAFIRHRLKTFIILTITKIDDSLMDPSLYHCNICTFVINLIVRIMNESGDTKQLIHLWSAMPTIVSTKKWHYKQRQRLDSLSKTTASAIPLKSQSSSHAQPRCSIHNNIIFPEILSANLFFIRNNSIRSQMQRVAAIISRFTVMSFFFKNWSIWLHYAKNIFVQQHCNEC